MPRRLTNDLDDEDGESLADALNHVSVQSRFDKTPHRFVPQRYIDSLITRSAIRDSLFEKGDNVDEDDEALIDYILRDAKRLFAITVLTGFKKLNSTCNAMFMFRDRGFTDRYLPLEDLPSANNEQPYDDDAPPMDISAHKLGAIGKPWTQAKIRTFCHEQWKLLAPVFSTNEDNHDLTIHTIPFIATNNEASEGSFGFVRKYIVHPDHIQGSWMPDIKVSELSLYERLGADIFLPHRIVPMSSPSKRSRKSIRQSKIPTRSRHTGHQKPKLWPK